MFSFHSAGFFFEHTDVPCMADLCCPPYLKTFFHPSEPVAFHRQFQSVFFPRDSIILSYIQLGFHNLIRTTGIQLTLKN